MNGILTTVALIVAIAGVFVTVHILTRCRHEQLSTYTQRIRYVGADKNRGDTIEIIKVCQYCKTITQTIRKPYL